MNKLLLGVLGTLGAGAVIGATAIYSGMVDVAADSPHSPLVYSLIETARERAIAWRAHDLSVPPDLNDTERARRGAGNYAAMCVGCHLSPGVENSEIRRGLYPQPPNLAGPDAEAADSERLAARRFWIIKHGIKASGMPAWSKGGMEDGAIWDLVAFLGRLPALSPEQYHELVEASEGHSHAGVAHQEAISDNGHVHDHSGHAQ